MKTRFTIARESVISEADVVILIVPNSVSPVFTEEDFAVKFLSESETFQDVEGENSSIFILSEAKVPDISFMFMLETIEIEHVTDEFGVSSDGHVIEREFETAEALLEKKKQKT